MNTVRVKDLKNQTGVGPHPFLYCSHCGAQYSANAGDYFMADPDHEFTCCGVPMRLVTKHVIYKDVE